MKGFGTFYTIKNKYRERKTLREKAYLIVKNMPIEFKKKTDIDFNDILIGDEKIIEDLMKDKSRINYLYKSIDYDYEYANYYANLNISRKSEKSFYEKYKNETYKGKSIKEYLKEFRYKIISKDELNNILTEFKKSNEKYSQIGSP